MSRGEDTEADKLAAAALREARAGRKQVPLSESTPAPGLRPSAPPEGLSALLIEAANALDPHPEKRGNADHWPSYRGLADRLRSAATRLAPEGKDARHEREALELILHDEGDISWSEAARVAAAILAAGYRKHAPTPEAHKESDHA